MARHPEGQTGVSQGTTGKEKHVRRQSRGADCVKVWKQDSMVLAWKTPSDVVGNAQTVMVADGVMAGCFQTVYRKGQPGSVPCTFLFPFSF